METVSYSELRQKLKAHMDRVCADHAPLLVTRQGGEAVVMLSLAEYESLEETLHLLSDPANAERLLRSIREAKEGKLTEHDLIE
jgi:antitoxin YefM